ARKNALASGPRICDCGIARSPTVTDLLKPRFVRGFLFGLGHFSSLFVSGFTRHECPLRIWDISRVWPNSGLCASERSGKKNPPFLAGEVKLVLWCVVFRRLLATPASGAAAVRPVPVCALRL